jgi:hypothetical protein
MRKQRSIRLCREALSTITSALLRPVVTRYAMDLNSLKRRLDPSSKSTDALQELLMPMRAEGKVKFDIYAGR